MAFPVDPRDATSVLDFLRSDDDGDINVPVVVPQPRSSSVLHSAVGHDQATSRNSSTRAAELHQLGQSERLARTECALSEADARVELWLHLPRATEDRAKTTYEHNRKMITTDLVQELYEANKQQREQMDQLIGVLMMLKQQQQQQSGTERASGRRR